MPKRVPIGYLPGELTQLDWDENSPFEEREEEGIIKVFKDGINRFFKKKPELKEKYERDYPRHFNPYTSK